MKRGSIPTYLHRQEDRRERRRNFGGSTSASAISACASRQKTTKKTIAGEYEKRRRQDLERTYAGLPSAAPSRRVHSVGNEDEVAVYLSDYPINHRPKSVIFSKQRLAHVKRLLGSALLPDLTEDRICGYIKARLAEGAGGRTLNMEVSVGFRFAYGLLEVSKWVPHSAARFWRTLERFPVGPSVSMVDDRRKGIEQ